MQNFICLQLDEKEQII